MRLFIERAQSALPSFALTTANAPAIDEICRRLDGLPLALELAAARVRVLSPEEIAGRLDDAFRLLTTGSRTALPRHRTLRATMEWSAALLSERERVLLRRLAIFAGSFTLEAAEAVCAGEPMESDDILDGMSTLVDKSLVVMESESGISRYRLLETVRQYAAEQLRDAGERATVERQYAEHFLAMLEAAEPDIAGGADYPARLAGLVAEYDNLRAVSLWSVADPARSDFALRFVGGMYWLWYALGMFREARQLTDRALALAPGSSPDLRGRAHLTSGLAALAQGEWERSRADLEARLPLLRGANDTRSTGTALATHGAALLLGGDLSSAVAVLDDTLSFTRDWAPYQIAVILARFWRGWAAYAEGDLPLAYELIDANVRVAREHQLPTTLAHSLGMLARIEFAQDRADVASALVLESLEREVAICDGWGIALTLDVVASLAARRGRHADAVRLVAGTEAHRARLAVALPEPNPAERLRLLAALRSSLGGGFHALHAEGLELSTADTVQLAFAEAMRDTAEHPVAASGGFVETDVRQAVHSRLRVLALGPLQVWVDDRLVDSSAWGSARPRELLAYLLVHPDGRTREQAGLAFWPDASPAQLRNNFHVTLYRLRRALGIRDLVVLDGDRYRLDPSLVAEFDVAAFERDVRVAHLALERGEEGALVRLELALARYRGDFLDGEPVGDWHVEHREHLQRVYVDALMQLGALHAREARPAKAVEAYRRVLARDELHEEALRALMRALAAGGERSQALRAYRRFAECMRAELEADPDAETRRLFLELQGAAAPVP